MVTVKVDLSADMFSHDPVADEDVTAICPPIAGIVPDKLVVGSPFGNPNVVDCRATFTDLKTARRWFAVVTDDPSVEWFEENVVA
jgi:hypothetical protein